MSAMRPVLERILWDLEEIERQLSGADLDGDERMARCLSIAVFGVRVAVKWVNRAMLGVDGGNL